MALAQVPRDAVPALRRFKLLQACALVLLLGPGRAFSGVENDLDSAVLASESGDQTSAFNHLKEAARLKPADPDIQAALGWAALRSKHPQEAQEALSLALRLDNTHPMALLGLGRLLLEAGKPLKAAETLEGLATVRPDFTLAHRLLARAYEALGEEQKAIEANQAALHSDPTYAEIHLDLGRLYARTEQSGQAWRHYARALDADPDNPTARRERQLLMKLVAARPGSELPSHRIASALPFVEAAAAKGMPLVRVALSTTAQGKPSPKKAVSFSSDGPFEIRDPESSRQLAVGPASEVWIARPAKGRYEVINQAQRRRLLFRKAIVVNPMEEGHSLLVQSLRLGSGTTWEAVSDLQLKGTVEIRARGQRGLYLVNILPLEDYLYGVITSEMPSNFPLEALKAQAIIARTMALYSKSILKPHRRYGYDLCDGQHCQVYHGILGEASEGRQAVDETRGKVLMAGRGLAQTPYSSNCGGHTQDSGALRGWVKLPYLKGRPDTDEVQDPLKSPWELGLWIKSRPQVYCNVPQYMHPAHFRWTRILAANELGRRVRRKARIGQLLSIRISRRSPSGNINRIEFRGTKGRYVVDKEHMIRNIMAMGSLRSTMFIIETERDAKGLPTEFYVYGGGWGHGVGLCQYGAVGRALYGQTADQILSRYYPGTRVETLGY